jgi:hypothetical protein
MPLGNRLPHQPVKLEAAVTGLAAGATGGATGACGPFAWAPLGAAVVAGAAVAADFTIGGVLEAAELAGAFAAGPDG